MIAAYQATMQNFECVSKSGIQILLILNLLFPILLKPYIEVDSFIVGIQCGVSSNLSSVSISKNLICLFLFKSLYDMVIVEATNGFELQKNSIENVFLLLIFMSIVYQISST